MSGKDEKFPLGPIIGPNPGPTLDIEVAAPEIDVIKSRPVKESKAASPRQPHPARQKLPTYACKGLQK